MKDEGIDIDIEETGSTYVENAVIKAKKDMRNDWTAGNGR